MSQKSKIGEIKKLFISSEIEQTRISQNDISVDVNGIVNDKFYHKNKDRAILLTSLHAYELMAEKDITCEYGSLGENILTDFNPYSLDEGTNIYIGDAILQITIECTICSFLTKINNKVPKLLKKDRGVFAKVIQKGSLNIGDDITIQN